MIYAGKADDTNKMRWTLDSEMRNALAAAIVPAWSFCLP